MKIIESKPVVRFAWLVGFDWIHHQYTITLDEQEYFSSASYFHNKLKDMAEVATIATVSIYF